MDPRMGKMQLRRTIKKLNVLREKLGSDVLDFELRNGNVVFLAHPTVGNKRPSLKALKAHVDEVTPLVFDPPSDRPEGSHEHSPKLSYVAVDPRPYLVW